MSLQSWKAKYYPVTAEDLQYSYDSSEFKGTKLEFDIIALEHAVLKWSGLNIEIIKDHGLELSSATLIDRYLKSGDLQFRINDNSCVLCLKYSFHDDCDGCPINKETSCCGVAPTVSTNDSTDHSNETPYAIFKFRDDAEPMLKILKAKLEMMQNQY